ncbi:MAG: OmpA family protein [Burkholderiales bacterium]|nr:OmpA family protein [Burkholderiales bacterium]MDE2627031.1 OmpA family protein [Burkholderiales bacterium]
MRLATSITTLLFGALAGCANQPPTAVTHRPVPPAAPAPAQPSLAEEQRRLAALFRGTPVVFEMQADGSLRVTVPLHFCFDRGSGIVKPPLAAVLDHVARSQRHESTRLRVAAAADPGSRALALARDRAESARDYLAARGIAAFRLSVAGAGVANLARDDGVEIVVSQPARR